MWKTDCPITDRRGQRGAILATVVIIAGVLFILVGVAWTYFTMAARTAAFTAGRTRALASAEAGVALAIHYLQSLEEKPASGEPFPVVMEGDSSGWTLLPGGGRARIVIDPYNMTGGPWQNGAVQIRTMGLSGGYTRSITAGAAPAYPSSYGLLTAEGIPEGFFVDGRIVNGAVHSNGPIYFSSFSPDSTGDPHGEMFSTTTEGGFHFSGWGRCDTPHPEGSSIWVMPYARHRQGSPYWRPAAPPIDFARMDSHFRGLLSSSGPNTLRVSAQRLLLDGNRVRFKESLNSPERSLDITEATLIIADNGFAPVVVKSLQPTQHPLTVMTRNGMIIGGPVDGGTVGSGGPLGLVSMGDVIIADDPDATGSPDWPGQWNIETDRPFLIRASIAVPNGTLRAEVPYRPQERTRVTVNGSLTQRLMGRMNSAASGYDLGVSWDQGLGGLHPPHFPLLGRWNIHSWLIDPPREENYDMGSDMV